MTSVVTTQAVDLLTSSTPEELFARFRPLISTTASDDRRPLEVADAKLAALTPTLTRRLLAACDPHLAHTDRLRHRTTTGTPRLADQQSGHVAAQRARHLPEYLWSEWIIRLRPLSGAFADTIATDVPIALLLPGNTTTRRNAASELTGTRSTGGGALGWLVARYPRHAHRAGRPGRPAVPHASPALSNTSRAGLVDLSQPV